MRTRPTANNPLKNRTAVITGATRGPGAALAHELGLRRTRLALLGHEEAGLRTMATSLPTASVAIEVDVTDSTALTRAVAQVRARLGRPSVVVVNAGFAQGGPFATSDPASQRRVIDVNLTGSAQPNNTPPCANYASTCPLACAPSTRPTPIPPAWHAQSNSAGWSAYTVLTARHPNHPLHPPPQPTRRNTGPALPLRRHGHGQGRLDEQAVRQ
ncbi:SDR family NAD(P)-dependent oxidoreductase [Streptomyces griseofuscus]|uniref:SDR family NAD(P)-dependent oxidoreductase n=1 Tax=Streptomyces griseofuscus TaxID=146922 RepID=UPI0036B7F5CD